jgi:DNA-binding MarR family transcriptional regulator
MKSTEFSLLPDDFFLVDVEDDNTKEAYKTLSPSHTPVMLLSFAASKFTEDASNYFKQLFGLGGVDWRMLFLLALRPGTTAAEASKTFGVDKGTVSRSVSRLTKGGLIVSGDLHANGRSRGLSLSSSGRDMHDQLLAATLNQHHFLMKGFDEAEVKIFCDLLLRFTANLEELSAANT